MNKTRLCHSVWTKPMQSVRWDNADQLIPNIWMFALSVHYANKNKAEIVLHTDSAGEKAFGFLPYDNIYQTLNKLNVHQRFWAAGKIFAQAAEPLGSIHIDGDVFIKTAQTIENLNFDGYDLIVQNEDGYAFEKDKQPIHDILTAVPDGYDYRHGSAYNCGITGFNNSNLKKKFIDGYMQMLQQCNASAKLRELLDKDSYYCPDLVIEQCWLKMLADYSVSAVKLLFAPCEDMQQKALEIGFTHVIGTVKYNMVERIKQRLLQENPDLYHKTRQQIAKLN